MLEVTRSTSLILFNSLRILSISCADKTPSVANLVISVLVFFTVCCNLLTSSAGFAINKLWTVFSISTAKSWIIISSGSIAFLRSIAVATLFVTETMSSKTSFETPCLICLKSKAPSNRRAR